MDKDATLEQQPRFLQKNYYHHNLPLIQEQMGYQYLRQVFIRGDEISSIIIGLCP